MFSGLRSSSDQSHGDLADQMNVDVGTNPMAKKVFSYNHVVHFFLLHFVSPKVPPFTAMSTPARLRRIREQVQPKSDSKEINRLPISAIAISLSPLFKVLSPIPLPYGWAAEI